MPAQTINLLSQKDFDQTLTGKFLRWALTYGRYIIISTEIIVLAAFINRFSLDRQLTDLNEEIEQKAAIVEANQGFESSFRNLQSRTNHIVSLTTQQSQIADIIAHLEQITPTGVILGTLNVTENKVTLNAVSLTSGNLTTFINNLKASPLLTNINITKASKKAAETAETSVEIEALLKNTSAIVSK